MVSWTFRLRASRGNGDGVDLQPDLQKRMPLGTANGRRCQPIAFAGLLAAVAVLALAQAGCLCWFVPCDARLSVTVHVYDTASRPIEGAIVTLRDGVRETDASGCSSFYGITNPGTMHLTVERAGFKPYRENRHFDPFLVSVTLAPADSEEDSRASWTKLDWGAAPAGNNCPQPVAAKPGTPGTATSGTILDRVPDAPNQWARYLIYLHGRIVEEQGRRPTHPEQGIYEYDRILEALAEGGAVVISEQRPKGTDPDRFAAHVAGQVRALERAGVPPERITVAGFSKGGGIAIRASSLLKEPRLNFVFLAACGDGDFEGTDFVVQGRILSIYEANDEIGRSCKNLFAKGAAPGERSEIEIHVGDHHGTFYRVHREWVDPLLTWVGTAPVPAT